MQAPALFCGPFFACFGRGFLASGPALSHPSAHDLTTTLVPVSWRGTAADADISKENRRGNIIGIVYRRISISTVKKECGSAAGTRLPPARLAPELSAIHPGHCYKPGPGATRDVVYSGRACFASSPRLP